MPLVHCQHRQNIPYYSPREKYCADLLQSFVRILVDLKGFQELRESDHHLKPMTLGLGHTNDQVTMYLGSPPRLPMRVMIISEVNRIVKATLKAKHMQATKKTPMDMLKSSLLPCPLV